MLTKHPICFIYPLNTAIRSRKAAPNKAKEQNFAYPIFSEHNKRARLISALPSIRRQFYNLLSRPLEPFTLIISELQVEAASILRTLPLDQAFDTLFPPFRRGLLDVFAWHSSEGFRHG